MSCSNCYNGCPEIISDQCVKYTGIDVPLLGIKNGDSLSYVEQALIEFLTSTLDGSGIIITLPPNTLCTVVSKYLPTCGEITVVTLFEAIVKAICEVNSIATGNTILLQQIYDGYNGSTCIPSITLTTPIDQVIQTVINTLCQLSSDFELFVADVETNYVTKTELCTLVAACAPSPDVTQYKDRMVPYTVVEYYGSLANFDLTGAGLAANGFENIYLCNGMNGTPDKRGVVGVGAIVGVPSSVPLNSKVNPATDPIFNPNYSLGGPVVGSNSITLSTAQIPTHSHTATSVVTDPGHSHTVAGSITPGGAGDGSRRGVVATINTSTSTTGITVGTTISSTGGNQAHANNQPALACYYIMYIP